MTFYKRLRVVWAAVTQTWLEFECTRCHQTAWISGDNGNLLDGLMCESCEVVEFEKWKTQYEARTGAKGAA